MTHRVRIFVIQALVAALLVPVTLAQKPGPAPSPNPPRAPTGPTNSPSNVPFPSSDPTQPTEDYVMFLRGRIVTPDGSAVPNDMLIERVCNNRVRQEVYATSRGDFSMLLGSRNDSFPEASVDSVVTNTSNNKNPSMGIPRRELTTCELRASASGFYTTVKNLLGLDPSSGDVDVGTIVMLRGAQPKGDTVSAIPYKAPKDARRAYEKGLQAESTGKLADAQKYFEKSVQVYPHSPHAWFHLGSVLQKQNQNDAARNAYTQSTNIDSKFLPPYLSLAFMAYRTKNWSDVARLTAHILDLDPLNRPDVTSYILDLDRANYVDAYFYNALANYNLNKLADAERSALKAERVDMGPRFPQVHLLLADIFARKSNYATSISELQRYLELLPDAKDADQIRDQLAKLQRLNAPPPTSETPTDAKPNYR